MNYQEAEDKAYKSEWAVVECGSKQAEGNCWCRMIEPKTEIRYTSENMEGDQKYYFVPSGAIDKKLAEYIVKLHNEKIKQA